MREPAGRKKRGIRKWEMEDKGITEGAMKG